MRWPSLFATLLFIAGQAALADEPAAPPAETAVQRADRMRWWREARFGMFIHWGPVSLRGTEIGWSRNPGPNGAGGGSIPAAQYDALYRQFNPSKFNAREWAATAKAAGMKYMVFTTKHHDGFCNFDSRLTAYKITSPESPFRRDVVKELAAACRDSGIHMGFYYSQPDSHHPDYRTPRHSQYIDYLHGQVAELLTNYGRIDVLWFDGLGGSARDWDAPRLMALIRKHQPQILVNDRCGLPADFSTPEQTIGGFQTERPWETCMTIGNQWAWRPGDDMKSLKQCLQVLITCAGGDGNLLFNVGPMPTGEIEPRQAERLREMGRWLEKYGESIYGTRGGPLKPGRGGVSTHKGDTIYLHVLQWQGDTIALPALPRKVVSATLLTGGQVKVLQQEDAISLTVAKADQQEIDTIVALKLDGPASDIAPLGMTPARGVIRPGMKATASNVFQRMAEYAPGHAVDGDSNTRWATDAGTHQAWLEVDLGRPTEVSGVSVDEACGRRVQQFEVQAQETGRWKTIFQGGEIGEGYSASFAPATVQIVRLNIVRASEGPTINEFQLHAPKKK